MHCRHPRWWYGQRQICARPNCSWECRDRWAYWVGQCLVRSHASLPPTHTLRLTILAALSYSAKQRALAKFNRRLRAAGYQYLVIWEWHHAVQHWHSLVRGPGPLTKADVRRWWQASLPARASFSSYCAPVRHAGKIGHYLVKDVTTPDKKELVPESFRGRVVVTSRGYLIRPLSVLRREVKAEYGARFHPAAAGVGTGTCAPGEQPATPSPEN
jgi:hypothetical protein